MRRTRNAPRWAGTRKGRACHLRGGVPGSVLTRHVALAGTQHAAQGCGKRASHFQTTRRPAQPWDVPAPTAPLGGRPARTPPLPGEVPGPGAWALAPEASLLEPPEHTLSAPHRCPARRGQRRPLGGLAGRPELTWCPAGEACVAVSGRHRGGRALAKHPILQRHRPPSSASGAGVQPAGRGHPRG